MAPIPDGPQISTLPNDRLSFLSGAVPLGGKCSRPQVNISLLCIKFHHSQFNSMDVGGGGGL